MEFTKDELLKIMFEELRIAQEIIKRMANNSFLIKGWSITLVIGILLLKGTEITAYLTYIPIVFFWYLDAYFLWLERLYRKLYDWIRENRLKTTEHLFDMNYSRFTGQEKTLLQVAFSKTLLSFHGSLLLLTTLYILFLL